MTPSLPGVAGHVFVSYKTEDRARVKPLVDGLAAEGLGGLARRPHRRGRPLTGGDPGQARRRWRARKAYTLDTAARALGLSRRMVAYYDRGAKPIPRTVALAVKALERGL